MDPRFTELHYAVLDIVREGPHRRLSQDAVQVRIAQRFGREIALGQVYEQLMDNGMLAPVNFQDPTRVDHTSKILELRAPGAAAIEDWEKLSWEERRKQSTHFERVLEVDPETGKPTGRTVMEQVGEPIMPPRPESVEGEPSTPKAPVRGIRQEPERGPTSPPAKPQNGTARKGAKGAAATRPSVPAKPKGPARPPAKPGALPRRQAAA